MTRPSFSSAWNAFAAVHLSVADVGKKIGGLVQKNIDMGVFTNACPIRMSYVLNTIGLPIQKSTHYATVTGGDHLQYIYRVKDMVKYLGDTLGKPDKIIKSPRPIDLAGMKGIIAVQGAGWSDATGHLTLWNGAECPDACHLMDDPDNGTFVPDTASIWVLP